MGSTRLWFLMVILLVFTNLQSPAYGGLPTLKHVQTGLARAKTVLVKVTADTPRGPIDPALLIEVVRRRMEELNYVVVTDPSQPHDVGLQIACHEPRDHVVPSQAEESSDRLSTGTFRGPPCLVGYSLNGKPATWRRVDRVVFTMGVEAAREAVAEDGAAGPPENFARYLERYEYPLLLAAEWGQAKVLKRLFHATHTAVQRKAMILSLLGEIRAEEGIPCMLQALEDEGLVQAAALTLGNYGSDVRPPLVTLLRTSPRADVQAAAAQSLGRIGATTGDWSLAPLFIEILGRPDLDLAVQVELAWALGKNPDRRALPILEELYDRVWNVRSEDPRLAELRKAIDWSHRSVRLGGHTDEY